MINFQNLEVNNKYLLTNSFFCGDFNQELYLKKSIDDGSHKPKFYLTIYANINNQSIMQGYLYFYLDYQSKTSSFIGIKVLNEYRNNNMASFLIASYISLCMNNGYEILNINPKQRKPFILYLLKTYGYEVNDLNLYEIRKDVISICRKKESDDLTKLLLFKDIKHELSFMSTNSYKFDNYQIVHSKDDLIILDQVIMPLQNASLIPINYELIDKDKAFNKTNLVLSRHKK